MENTKYSELQAAENRLDAKAGRALAHRETGLLLAFQERKLRSEGHQKAQA